MSTKTNLLKFFADKQVQELHVTKTKPIRDKISTICKEFYHNRMSMEIHFVNAHPANISKTMWINIVNRLLDVINYENETKPPFMLRIIVKWTPPLATKEFQLKMFGNVAEIRREKDLSVLDFDHIATRKYEDVGLAKPVKPNSFSDFLSDNTKQTDLQKMNAFIESCPKKTEIVEEESVLNITRILQDKSFVAKLFPNSKSGIYDVRFYVIITENVLEDMAVD